MEIADKIAALIGKENIHLNTPVVSIDDQTSRVIIRAKTGPQFHARKCIISIPSTMYRELTSTPPLPPPVQEMTNATRLDHYNKAIVCYDKLWWKNLLYNGFFFSYKGPIAIARDSSVPEKDLYELMCLVNGRAGEEWSKLDVYARRRWLLSLPWVIIPDLQRFMGSRLGICTLWARSLRVIGRGMWRGR